MWRPAERIKYKPDPGFWPSAEAAAASRLFSAVKVGQTVLPHRTWVPAMVPWRATDDGHVTEDVLDWYRRFAAGQPAVLVVEATGIREIPSGPLLRIGDDRFVPGLQQLVDVVRDASDGKTKLFIQLIDFLRINRRPTADNFFQRHLNISDDHRRCFEDGLPDDALRSQLRAMDDEALQQILTPREFSDYSRGYREKVDDMHLPHIRELPEKLPPLFASAADRARRAGFDGVELHYAHAYTMASFISPRNQRDDGYGGAREDRVRLPLEVFAAVRQTVGNDFVVGCRYLASDCIEEGLTVDDAAYMGTRFAAAGMDFLSLSRGGKFEDAKQPKVGAAAYPYTGQSGYECMPQYISDATGPFGRNISATAQIRRTVRESGSDVPIVLAGGIYSFRQAEEALKNGEADIIAAARQTLADPDWFLKMRLGQGEKVRVCLYTNYCEALDTKHKQVTCELWDRDDLSEPGVKKSHDGRRRLTAPSWTPQDGGAS